MKHITVAVGLVLATAPAAYAQSEASSDVSATLSDSERRTLHQGEYSTLEIVGSGVVGTFLGLGTGQAIQGRYGDTGWIFTVGELGSLGLMIAGVATCTNVGDCNTLLIAGGLIGALGFRVWELIDVWTVPLAHNRRVRSLKNRTAPTYSVFAAPTGDKSGVLGLSMQF